MSLGLKAVGSGCVMGSGVGCNLHCSGIILHHGIKPNVLMAQSDGRPFPHFTPTTVCTLYVLRRRDGYQRTFLIDYVLWYFSIFNDCGISPSFHTLDNTTHQLLLW